MKRLVTGLFSVMLLLPATALLAQQDKEKHKEKYEFVKKKDISKTYPSGGNKLAINNSFGDVKYVTWDKNEIKVDVHIEASANKDEMAQKLIDAITVTDKQQGSEIQFKTSINNNNSQENCKNCKSSMEINYEVHLPASVTLNSENSFGNTEIPDYTGQLTISNKFGELTAGALSNVKGIEVEFGKADIKSIGNITASFKFSTIVIGNLTGKNNIHLEFCDATRISVDNGLTGLKLDESYSTVNLRVNNSFSATYNIHSSFGTVLDRSNIGVRRTDTPDKYGPDSEKTFEGKAGSGAVAIDIRSSFGKIILGEPTADDLKADKAKNKSKRTRVI